MSDVESTSMISDVDLNISQLRILLRILCNKLSTKMFEPENIMKSLSGDIILPKFSEYKHDNEKEVNLNTFYFGLVILLLFLRKRHNC